MKTTVRILSVIAVALCSTRAFAADADPCTRFTWDVSRELATMKQTPQPLTAAVKAGASVPEVKLASLFDVKLASQGSVAFALKPGKPTLDDASMGGLLRFHLDQLGLYRVAITSGHWIDILQGTKVINSRDFQGQRGCERPRKIVEYEIPTAGDFLLQLSGASDPGVLLSITQAPTPARN